VSLFWSSSALPKQPFLSMSAQPSPQQLGTLAYRTSISYRMSRSKVYVMRGKPNSSGLVALPVPTKPGSWLTTQKQQSMN